MSSKPTPITGGAWRVVNGQLIDESQVQSAPIEQVAEPVWASPDERAGGPDIPVPPIDAPASPRKSKSKPVPQE